MNRKTKELLSTWLIRIAVFFLLVLVFWKVPVIVKPYLNRVLSDVLDDQSSKVEIGSSVLSTIVKYFLSVVLTPLITKCIESLFSPPQKLPKIMITAPNNNVNNISGVKTINSCPQNLCINFGQIGNQFRIVHAIVKNTGESSITGISINGKKTSFTLEPKTSNPVYFIVSESDMATWRDDSFDFPYNICDDQGHLFSGWYRIKLNDNQTCASFYPTKRIRRRLFKNVL